MLAPLPSEIRVGPFRFQVFCDHEHIGRFRYDQGDTPLGACNCDDQTILLDPDRPPQGRKKTLLHETLHAVASVVNAPRGDETATQEQFVTALSPMLLDTLQRNPALVAYLASEAE